jgi:uridine phosphorylase
VVDTLPIPPIPPIPPILEFDPDRDAVIHPAAVATRREQAPEHAVMCFFSDVIADIALSGAPVLWELQAAHGVHPVYAVEFGGRPLAVFHPGVGAPLAAAFFEEAIASGCRRFVAVGDAGGLVPELTLGHVVVPTAAVRDEGTSYHYLPASREVEPAPEAIAAIEATLTAHGVAFVRGKTWTTDAFYRETRGRVTRRVQEGCITVEMEAAALLAVSRFRAVPLGIMLAAADDLSGEDWDDRGFLSDGSIRRRLFELAAEACLRI